MPVNQVSTGNTPQSGRHRATGSPVVETAGLGADLVRILDELVDVIEVRESFDPDCSGWDTGILIRRLERDLARTWAASRPAGPGLEAARRWHQ